MQMALHFPIDLPAAHPIAGRVTSAIPTFEQIVETHYQGLYRFALSMCRRDATAQDLVQQTFLQWARKGHTLRDSAKVKTWLFTTLYRDWLSQARREKKYEEIEFEPDLHGARHEEHAAPPRVDGSTLQRALDELPASYRAPLVLFYLKELSYKEIAETLGVPIGTVMSRLSRAKDLLRSILQRIEERTSSNIITADFQPRSNP